MERKNINRGYKQLCLYSFKMANQISEKAFEEIDSLHYKTENELLALIKSLNNKLKNS